MKRKQKMSYFAMACTAGLMANSPMADAAIVNFSFEELGMEAENVATDGTIHTSASFLNLPIIDTSSQVINGIEWNQRTAGRHIEPVGNTNGASSLNTRNDITLHYDSFDPANPGLKAVTDSITFDATMTLTINDLSLGQAYRLQYISFDAEVDGETVNGQTAPIRERLQRVEVGGGNTGSLDYNQFLVGPGDFGGQDDFRGALVTATWTADATSIDFNMSALNGNDNVILNAFVVQAVPEPSSTALLGLGGLALMLRRRR